MEWFLFLIPPALVAWWFYRSKCVPMYNPDTQEWILAPRRDVDFHRFRGFERKDP
jgi:hypothetical protein